MTVYYFIEIATVEIDILLHNFAAKLNINGP